jgi:hypothetical protein
VVRRAGRRRKWPATYPPIPLHWATFLRANWPAIYGSAQNQSGPGPYRAPSCTPVCPRAPVRPRASRMFRRKGSRGVRWRAGWRTVPNPAHPAAHPSFFGHHPPIQRSKSRIPDPLRIALQIAAPRAPLRTLCISPFGPPRHAPLRSACRLVVHEAPLLSARAPPARLYEGHARLRTNGTPSKFESPLVTDP